MKVLKFLMSMKTAFYLLLIVGDQNLNAQSYIPNGYFEEYSFLLTGFGQSDLCGHWNNVNGVYNGGFGSPDYFHNLSFSGLSIGDIAAYSGKAQIGIVLYEDGGALPNFREYISNELTSNLMVERKYKGSFF